MNKILAMIPPTAFLLVLLEMPFDDLIKGDIFRAFLGLLIRGSVGGIIWFLAYRFICTDMK